MFAGMDEFRQRYAGRYFGKYRAKVVRTDDPLKLGRLLLQVPVILGNEGTIGWALASNGGGVNNGAVWMPSVNDFVWVEFEEGDPNRAVWSAGPWGRQNDEDMMIRHARGLTDDEDVLVRDMGVMPPTQYQGEYPHVRGWRSKAGSLLEFDDTPGAERVQLAHYSGSRLEFLPDGSTQQVSVAGLRRRVAGNVVEEITGNYEQTIGGNRVTTVKGSDTVNYEVKEVTTNYQNYSVTGKAHTAEWDGDHTTTTTGTYTLGIASQISIQSGGQLAFMIGQNLQMTALENIEIAASNATNGPDNNSILLQGYNGPVEFLATDVAGSVLVPASKMQILMEPGQFPLYAPGAGKMTFSAGGGGLIELNNTPSLANVLLTGSGASEPFILGNQMIALLTTILSDLATHIHPTGTGLSGPPATGSVYTQAVSDLISTLSLKIMGS